MASIFASTLARHIQRPVAPLRSSFAITASSSRAFSSSVLLSKAKNAPALNISHAGQQAVLSETEKAKLEDIANLTEEAGARLELAQGIALPEIQYKAVQPLNAYDPYSLKRSRMLKPTPAQLQRRRPRHQLPRLGPDATTSLQNDPLQYYSIRPERETMNPVFLNEFVTEMGRIKGRNETKLSRRSQRFVGKAVRRARAMGIMPTLHRPVMAQIMRKPNASYRFNRNLQ